MGKVDNPAKFERPTGLAILIAPHVASAESLLAVCATVSLAFQSMNPKICGVIQPIGSCRYFAASTYPGIMFQS
jgi:hypothetical protein